MNQHKLLSVALALTTAFTGVATAGAPVQPRQIVVSYSDLNLTRTADQARLNARIRAAARQVCEPLQSRLLGLQRDHDRCVADAIANGRSQVPALTVRS